MVLNGIVIGFDLEQAETLKPLITECGYSAPTKNDPFARKSNYMQSTGVEIQRVDSRAFITIYPHDVSECDGAVTEVLSDLRRAGLLP